METQEFLIIVSVKPTETEFKLTCDSKHFSLEKKYNVTPQVGDVVTIYCIGSFIRGMDINNTNIYYYSAKEIKQIEEAHTKLYEQEKIEKFIAKKEQMDKDYEALPEPFRDLIDRYRKSDPNFRVNYESYELFCCKEAMKILEILKTPQEILDFSRLPYELQKRIIPNIDDDNSLNTLDNAIRYAYSYLSGIIKGNIAGALAPIVSKTYSTKSKNKFFNLFKKK